MALDHFRARYLRFIALKTGRADGLPLINPAFRLPPVPILREPFKQDDLLALVASAARILRRAAIVHLAEFRTSPVSPTILRHCADMCRWGRPIGRAP